ncbi:MAG: hypothetical protein E7K48_05875 [Varibaculum cambriense]|nr:hypothetical protein [Varibaculum cambriense]
MTKAIPGISALAQRDASNRGLDGTDRPGRQNGGGIMGRVILAFFTATAMIAFPVLVLMGQLYLSAALGVTAIALATWLLVSTGENKK